MKITTHKDYLHFLKNSGVKLKVTENYVNSYTRIEHKCEKGHKFLARPDKLKIDIAEKKNPCRECFDRRAAANDAARMTLKEYNSLIREFGIKAKSYVNAYTEVEHVCDAGHTFTTKPSIVRISGSCPNCLTPTLKAKLKNLQPLYKEMGIKITSTRRNGSTTCFIECACNRCGHAWDSTLKTRPDKCTECKSVSKQENKESKSYKKIGVRKAPIEVRAKAFADAVSDKFPDIKIIGKYKNSDHSIKLKHVTCGNSWATKPTNLLASKVGCPECGRKRANENTKISETEIYKRIAVASDGHVKPASAYNGYGKLMKFSCSCGHTFSAKPNQLVANGRHGCVKCHKVGSNTFSKSAVEWLSLVADTYGIKIQHAGNTGEKQIQIGKKKIRVDGYCKETNTVYEFLGDDWHGSPYRHKADKKCNPHSDKTAKQLYGESIKRFTRLSQKGFSVVWVWESHYRRGELLSGRLIGN